MSPHPPPLLHLTLPKLPAHSVSRALSPSSPLLPLPSLSLKPPQLRRAYWSPALDAKLYGDATALNLLYIQTIADIKNGWISVDDTVADELASYRASKDRLAFLRVASRLEGYGFTNFGQVTINIPEVGAGVREGDGREWGEGAECYFVLVLTGRACSSCPQDGNTGVVSIGQGVLLVVPSVCDLQKGAWSLPNVISSFSPSPIHPLLFTLSCHPLMFRAARGKSMPSSACAAGGHTAPTLAWKWSLSTTSTRPQRAPRAR